MKPQSERQSRGARAAASLGTVVGLTLLPKCPLCVAAVLCSLGLGATTASAAAPFVRPLAVAFAVAAGLVLGYGELRRARSKGGTASTARCCSR